MSFNFTIPPRIVLSGEPLGLYRKGATRHTEGSDIYMLALLNGLNMPYPAGAQFNLKLGELNHNCSGISNDGKSRFTIPQHIYQHHWMNEASSPEGPRFWDMVWRHGAAGAVITPKMLLRIEEFRETLDRLGLPTFRPI